MAKLIRILAASVGGGLCLGAGIRLGGAITARKGASSAGDANFAERLRRLEGRLSKLADAGRLGVNDHVPHVSPAQVVTESNPTEPADFAANLRSELREWLGEAVGTRMAEVERKLKAESERSQKQILDAFIESVQTRVIHRISSLEEEFLSQSAAMAELRECSLRTERSMQKLLGGLDRLIVTPAANDAPTVPRESDAH